MEKPFPIDCGFLFVAFLKKPFSPAVFPRSFLSGFLVHWARVELARVTPPPPQDGVSTSSTTSARAPSSFFRPRKGYYK